MLGRWPRRAIHESAGKSRLWLPILGIVAVLSFLVFGGYVLVLPFSMPAGPPVHVGDVLILPLSGWEVVGQAGEGTESSIRLSRGNGNLDVLTGPFRGRATQLLAAYVQQSLEPATGRLAVSRTPQEVRVGSAAIALRLSYVGAFADRGTSIEGQVTAFVTPRGVGVLFNAWAPRGLLSFIVGDVDRMIDTAGLR